MNKPHEAVGDGTVVGLCGAFVINRLMNLLTRRLRSWEIDEMPKEYRSHLEAHVNAHTNFHSNTCNS